MEDMARLAVLEQNTRDTDTFNETLKKLLQYIAYILEDPQDSELRTIKSKLLIMSLDIDGFPDYLKCIGFQIKEKDIIFPDDQSLSRLRMAKAAIERKLHFSCGAGVHLQPSKSTPRMNKVDFEPAKVLKTKNDFLLKLQFLFNDVLKYEDEELQKFTREKMPMVTLQLRAMGRLRAHQKKIKSGETTIPDLSFDVALLMELLLWFKHEFFTWVDNPECDECGGATKYSATGTLRTDTETCRLEIHECVSKSCGARNEFPRYNNPRALLRSRRGRCGEWANCFVLVARSVGYETRYVYDVTDHVWCEVYDHDSRRWLHVDPCEAQLNTPLVYENGWGKQLQYVVAVSRDDIQDVTWRYSSNHAAVLARRKLCTESELIDAIQLLRGHRHKQMSEPRRRYLQKREVEELVQMMVERKPSDYEGSGRISGSESWRAGRGELGARSHTFELREPGKYSIRYYAASDKYRVLLNGQLVSRVLGWAAGAFACEDLFRKEEADWKMVYLAREEGATTGSISWRVCSASPLASLSVRAVTKRYQSGRVAWAVRFDGGDPETFEMGDALHKFARRFKQATLTATLSGGAGGVAWQHAQLFRQATSDEQCALDIRVMCE